LIHALPNPPPRSGGGDKKGIYATKQIFNRVIIPFLVGLTILPAIFIGMKYLWERFWVAPKTRETESTHLLKNSKEKVSFRDEAIAFWLFFRQNVSR
jgi:hypothetical protein